MHYSPAHDALVFNETPFKIMSVCAGAKRLSENIVAVPATLANLQALRANDLPVIAPMQKDAYDWPIRAPWQPLPHQQVTANFLALHKRCLCLNDMGTMKTLSSLWAADYLMEMERREGRRLRALIICPLSIMRAVWADAVFQNFIGRRKAVVVHGGAVKRQKLLAQDADFYIINHDGLGVGVKHDRKMEFEGLAKDIMDRKDIRLALVDEASVYRDHTTRRHRIARVMLGRMDYLWLMTGTPTPTGPLDAYGLAKLVNDAWGESFKTYQARVMVAMGPFKWVPRAGSSQAARKMLQPAIRYSIEDCVNLPPCTTQARDAELSAAQAVAYRALKAEAVLMMQSGQHIHAVNQAALRIKLIQVACGAVYDSEHDSHEIDASPRVQVLEEAIAECAEKIIVFAPLTNVLNMLYRRLKGKHSCAIINGSVSQNERTEIFRGFQSGTSPRILIADPATMAHGLTLTAASAVIWYAPTDKTELYIQANKRIDRPGQTKNTTVIQIAATAIEREIYRRLESNQSMQGVILKLAEET